MREGGGGGEANFVSSCNCRGINAQEEGKKKQHLSFTAFLNAHWNFPNENGRHLWQQKSSWMCEGRDGPPVNEWREKIKKKNAVLVVLCSEGIGYLD